ncbi:Formylglycine-generating enzyme, required for sulfatase activity, contains SUMF1/FGE domain [Parapedobacter composti]|uniref:Formylglycine-generating enzyme, required for sulfatase activity, contains SUMF1/FGE domain n=1 Tax=Parapedobacter composti TaxID=623281 RepID=A0A1I1MGX9_9SPHI|nr:formylglycine-generating enzyme family protein [Parapedobacter composti]SFC80840.1 Formylglycine-generating enzyme, required for sulfatase activity, contains SUMF1/FGE domain [Parapedobacter composti]
MKKHLILFVMLLACYTSQAQNTVAKLKYEDAEKAFYDGNYQNCISLLDETEKLLGQTAPNILYLRIMAEGKIWEANPYESNEQVNKLQQLCKQYMQNYDIAGLENKYREVYDLSMKLPTIEVYQAQVRKQANIDSIISLSGIPMAFVKGGTFMMGSSNNKEVNDKNLSHNIQLSDFYIGKYEIMVGQFRTFVQETGYQTSAEKKAHSRLWTGKRWREKKGTNWRHGVDGKEYNEGSDNYPVIHVSYDDAMSFCKWLSEKTGGNWRLPTEAEWEYSAKGGEKNENFIYSGSNDIEEVAWYENNSEGGTHPVGQKKANKLGIYDMSGNVREWCYDWWDKGYYAKSPNKDPLGPSTGTWRTFRGGDWSDDIMRYLNIAYRHGGFDQLRTDNISGFRVVYIPD